MGASQQCWPWGGPLRHKPCRCRRRHGRGSVLRLPYALASCTAERLLTIATGIQRTHSTLHAAKKKKKKGSVEQQVQVPVSVGDATAISVSVDYGDIKSQQQTGYHTTQLLLGSRGYDVIDWLQRPVLSRAIPMKLRFQSWFLDQHSREKRHRNVACTGYH